MDLTRKRLERGKSPRPTNPQPRRRETYQHMKTSGLSISTGRVVQFYRQDGSPTTAKEALDHAMPKGGAIRTLRMWRNWSKHKTRQSKALAVGME